MWSTEEETILKDTFWNTDPEKIQALLIKRGFFRSVLGIKNKAVYMGLRKGFKYPEEIIDLAQKLIVTLPLPQAVKAFNKETGRDFTPEQLRDAARPPQTTHFLKSQEQDLLEFGSILTNQVLANWLNFKYGTTFSAINIRDKLSEMGIEKRPDGFSIKECSEITGASVHVLHHLIKRGKLSAKKHGKLWIIESSELDRLQKKYPKAHFDDPIDLIPAAEMAGFSDDTVRSWIHRGYLMHIKHGHRFIVSKADLARVVNEYLENRNDIKQAAKPEQEKPVLYSEIPPDTFSLTHVARVTGIKFWVLNDRLKKTPLFGVAYHPQKRLWSVSTEGIINIIKTFCQPDHK